MSDYRPTTSKRESSNYIRTFAEKHYLKTRTDGCGETIIPGKRGASHLFYYGNWSGEFSPQTFAVMFMPDPQGKRVPATRRWNRYKAEMLAAGFSIAQDCDGDAVARFDPTNKKQVELAMRVAGVKRRRVPSPAQLAVLESARKRLEHCAEATSAV